MDIKDNIKGEVLTAVADDLNVTEDLLIQMVSSDLHNSMVTIFSIALGILLLMLLSGFITYFQIKKSDGDDDHMFFGTVSGIICAICLVVSFFILLGTSVYEKQFETIYNHEYAIVKQINKMYDEVINPTEDNDIQ